MAFREHPLLSQMHIDNVRLMLQIDQAHAAVARSRTKARLSYARSLTYMHARTRLVLAHICECAIYK